MLLPVVLDVSFSYGVHLSKLYELLPNLCITVLQIEHITRVSSQLSSTEAPVTLYAIPYASRSPWFFRLLICFSQTLLGLFVWRQEIVMMGTVHPTRMSVACFCNHRT